MKRSTKKIVFITTMIITSISLFAISGKHHRVAGNHGCHSQSQHCKNDEFKKMNDRKENAIEESTSIEK